MWRHSRSRSRIHPRRPRPVRTCNSRGETDDRLNQLLWTVERKEVAAALDGGHFHARDQIAVMFALRRPRPVLVAPDEEHGDVYTAVVFGRRLPTFSVAQQLEEGAIVARAIAHEIHLLHQGRGDAVRLG